MSAGLPNSSVCQEHALNALIEIRACHDELRTFLADTFDRLDEVVNHLRPERPVAHVERVADAVVMQDQIDHLTRLVSDLAHSIKSREQSDAGEAQAR